MYSPIHDDQIGYKKNIYMQSILSVLKILNHIPAPTHLYKQHSRININYIESVQLRVHVHQSISDIFIVVSFRVGVHTTYYRMFACACVYVDVIKCVRVFLCICSCAGLYHGTHLSFTNS